MGSIREAISSITNFTESTKEFFIGTSKIFHFVSHPSESAVIVWNGTLKYSYSVFTLICLGAIIAYLIGYKKGKKIAYGSFMFYFVLHMINSGLKFK